MSRDNPIALCAIARNEAPYLAEWAIYHRLIGFDEILVYENESTDDSAAVLRKLQDAGIARLLPWPSRTDGQAQKRAYADGLKRLRPNYKWIAFFDIDEFLYIPGFDNSLERFLAAFDHLDAIAVNWAMFGTSGHEHRAPGLVIERFTQRAKSEHSGNRAVKTIVKTRALKLPNLHNHEFAEGVAYQTVAGDPILPGTGRSATVSHEVVRLNHYFTKSKQEWDAKVARGRATKPDNHPDKFRKANDFRRHNRNEVDDPSLLAYVEPLSRRLDEIGLRTEPPGA